MRIEPMTSGHPLWHALREYARSCAWGAGAGLARQMEEGGFGDWERVFAAVDGARIAGYCTLAKTDCIPDVPYTPYIGYVFVDEGYRGGRLSETLIRAALAYAREVGFEKVYLVSDHINLYEKYGFVKIDEKPAPWNPDTMESIFVHPV